MRSPHHARPLRTGIMVALVASVALATPGAAHAQQANRARAAKIAKVPVENEASCKVTTTFFGEGFNERGKKIKLKRGQRKNLRLKAPGTVYSWTATGKCCLDGEGEFDAPLTKKGNAPRVFECTPPLSTPFGLTSPAFLDGGTIPTVYTCDGANTAPPLALQNVPLGTMSFVLILDDPDAPGATFTHWVLFDIPAGRATLPEGFMPGDYGVSALNDAARTGYFGACSPPGDAPHRYFFKLFALDVATLDLPEGATRAQVEAAMAGHVLSEAQLLAFFARG